MLCLITDALPAHPSRPGTIFWNVRLTAMKRVKPKRVPLRPDGQPMTADDISELRERIEGFDTIEVIADEMREIVERYMPDLVDGDARAESPRKR